MPLETLLHFISCLLNVLFPFILKSTLDLIQLSYTLIPQSEILLSHLADQLLDIGCLFFKCFGILIIFFLEFFPKLVDQFIFSCYHLLEGLLLFADSLNRQRTTFDRDQHSSYSLSSDHLIYRAVFFLLDATASCWMVTSLSCALRQSQMREFFCSCQFLTLRSTMGQFCWLLTLSMALKLFPICCLPAGIEVALFMAILLLSCINRQLFKLRNMMLDNEEYSQIRAKNEQQVSRLTQHPSLIGGYTLLYDNNVPIEMKYVDYDRNVNHLGSREVVNFKIYTFGAKPNIGKIKIEIESQSDPFFVAKYECDENTFNMMKKQQKLNICLQELPTIIIKCLNKIEEAKKKLCAELLIHSDGKSKLSLNYSSQFKNIEILQLDLNQENDEKLEEIIKFKYQALRKSIQKAELRLLKINEIIKEKNPSLLHQIFKSTRKQ